MDPESNPITAAASEVKSAARNVLQALNGFDSTYVEGLETQVLELEGQVTTLETRNANLFQSYLVLKQRLQDAKKNCYDPDSPAAMSGDWLPPDE